MDRTRLFSLCVAVLWLGAFFFSLPLAQPPEFARLAAAGFMALAGFCALRAWGAPGLKSPLMIAALLFWANAGLSILWSPAPLASFVAFCTFSLLPFGMIAFSRAPESFYRFCAWGAGIVLGALACWVFIQYFWLREFLVHGQPRHPFANTNSFAALLALGFFPALGMAASSGPAALLGALLGGAIAVIGGRAVILLTVIFTVIFLLVTRRSAFAGRRRLFAMMAGIVLACVLSLIFKATPGGAPVERLLEMQGIGAQRTLIWEGALALIRDHFPLGTGFGTFYLYYPQYRLPAEIYSSGYMAHSDPLQFAAETGIAAPALFYAFLLFAVLRMARSWRARRESLLLAVFFGLGAMITHSHMDFDLYTPSILALSAPLLGWWLRQTALPAAAAGQAPMDNIRFAMLALPVLAALFVLQGFLRSEYHATVAQKEMIAGRMADFAADIEKSNRAGWGWNARPYLMAAAIPLGILEMGAPPEEKAALIKKAESLLGRAADKNPRSATVPYLRARLALATEDKPAAQEYFRQALSLVPQHLSARKELADILPENESYELLKDGLKWRYGRDNAPEYYAFVAALATARGDPQTAQEALAKAGASKRSGTRAAVPPFMEEGFAGSGL